MTVYIEGGLEPYVQIEPIQVKFTDLVMAEALFVSIDYDDLYSTCTLLYRLGTLVPNLDDDGILINHNSVSLYHGRETVTGTDYTDWSGDNLYPFQFILTKLGLTEVI